MYDGPAIVKLWVINKNLDHVFYRYNAAEVFRDLHFVCLKRNRKEWKKEEIVTFSRLVNWEEKKKKMATSPNLNLIEKKNDYENLIKN